MGIYDYIKKIQQEIDSDKPYEEYAISFKEYKIFLESLVEQNPRDVVATCQLAIVLVELRNDSDVSINLMEEFLVKYENELTHDEKLRIYINLAFFYEEDGCVDKLVPILEKAIALQPNTPVPYNSRAMSILEEDMGRPTKENAIIALPFFEQATKLSNSFMYHYNYAVGLYYSGNITGAKNIFERLIEQRRNMKALFGVAVCSYFLDDKKTTIDILKFLVANDKDEEVAEHQRAELFYLCEDYENSNAEHTKMDYYVRADWVAPYFYCLRVLNKKEELLAVYEKFVNSKKEDLERTKLSELDDYYTFEKQTEDIKELQQELDDIEEAYRRIVHEDYKPEVSSPQLIFEYYGCYLFDCPRHQRIQ